MTEHLCVNLLPYSVRVRRTVVRCLRNVAVVALVALGVIASSYVTACRSLARVQQEHQQCSARVEPVLEAIRLNEEARRQLKDITRQREQLSKYLTDKRAFYVLGPSVDFIRSHQGILRLERLSMSALPVHSEEAEKSAKKPSTEPQSVFVNLSLQGIAKDQKYIAEYVDSLRQSELFEAVELKSSGRQQSEGAAARLFLIECRRREPL